MSELADLEALLPSLPDAVKRTRFGDGLKQVAQEISDVASRTADAKALIEIASITEFASTPHRTELLETMVDWCELAARKLDAADSDVALRDAKENYGEFKRALSSVRSALSEHWESTRARLFDPLKVYGAILGLVPDLGRLAQAFIDCAQNARRVSMAQGSQALRDHIRSMLAELERLQASRAAMVQDPSVGQFLNALADGRATAEHLTDEVIRWLREHNVVGRFRITPLAS